MVRALNRNANLGQSNLNAGAPTMISLDTNLLTEDALREAVKSHLVNNGISFSYPNADSIFGIIHKVTTNAFIELIEHGYYDKENWLLHRSIRQDAFDLKASISLLKHSLRAGKPGIAAHKDINQIVSEQLTKANKWSMNQASRCDKEIAALLAYGKLPNETVDCINQSFVRLIKEYDIAIICRFRNIIKALDIDLASAINHQIITDLITDEHYYIAEYLRGEPLSQAMIQMLAVSGDTAAINLFERGPSDDSVCKLTNRNGINKLLDYAKYPHASKDILSFVLEKCTFGQDAVYVSFALNALCNHVMPNSCAVDLLKKLTFNPNLIIGPEVSDINTVIEKYNIELPVLDAFRKAAYARYGLKFSFGVISDGSNIYAVNRIDQKEFNEVSNAIVNSICNHDAPMEQKDALHCAFELVSSHKQKLSNECMIKLASYAIDTNHDLLMAAISDHYHLNRDAQEDILNKYINSDVMNTGHWPWIMHPFLSTQHEVHADLFARFLSTVQTDHYSYSENARGLLSRHNVYLPSDEDGELTASIRRAHYTIESASELLANASRVEGFELEALSAIGMKMLNLILSDSVGSAKPIDKDAFDKALAEVICAEPNANVSDYINLYSDVIRELMGNSKSNLHKTSEVAPVFYEDLVSGILKDKMANLSQPSELIHTRKCSI